MKTVTNDYRFHIRREHIFKAQMHLRDTVGSVRGHHKDTNHHEANHIDFGFLVLIKVMFALNYSLVSVQ